LHRENHEKDTRGHSACYQGDSEKKTEEKKKIDHVLPGVGEKDRGTKNVLKVPKSLKGTGKKRRGVGKTRNCLHKKRAAWEGRTEGKNPKHRKKKRPNQIKQTAPIKKKRLTKNSRGPFMTSGGGGGGRGHKRTETFPLCQHKLVKRSYHSLQGGAK